MKVVDGKGGWRLSPLVDLIARAELTLSRATAELGFSPASRSKLHTGPAVDETPVAPAWGNKLAA
jgi:phage terminase small subunit